MHAPNTKTIFCRLVPERVDGGKRPEGQVPEAVPPGALEQSVVKGVLWLIAVLAFCTVSLADAVKE